MKRHALALLLLLALPGLALAQTTTYRYPNGDGSVSNSAVELCPNAAGTATTDCASLGSIPVSGRQTLTGLTSSTALTVPSGALVAVISVAGNSVPVHWTADGTVPTGSIGQSMQPGVPYVFRVTPLSALRFIREFSGTAQIDVDYFK